MTDIENETWVYIPGFSDYRINSHGEVLSYRQSKLGKVLKSWLDDKGYPHVVLYGDDVGRKEFKVHQLVALVYHGPRPEGKCVRHLDGNPLNNTPQNLVYGSYSENNFDLVEHGTHFEANRTHCDNGHEYTPENTMWRTCNKKGSKNFGKKYRGCKTCHAIYIARWRVKKAGKPVPSLK